MVVLVLSACGGGAPPAEREEPAIAATRGASGDETRELPSITLVPPGGSRFDTAEVAILAAASEPGASHARGALHDGSLQLGHRDLAAFTTAARGSDTGRFLAKGHNGSDALRFEIDLPPGVYVVCGIVSRNGIADAAGCQVVETTPSGAFSPAFVRLEGVQRHPHDDTSPDLKDPFAGARPAAEDDASPTEASDVARPRRRRSAKANDSPDLKDPFRDP